MGRLRLRQLEMLLVVAHEGTLTGAARALGATQPAMSQMLLEVETALGCQLFLRGRKLQPTPSLEPTLRYARRALADAGQLADDLRKAAQGWAGRVRVGSMMVGVSNLLPRTVAALRRAGSELEVEIHEDIAAGLWPRLMRDEIDILVGRIDPRGLGTDLKFEALFEDRHCVVVGKDHPLLGESSPDLRAAARYPWTLPPRRTPLRNMIDENFAMAGVAPPSCWQETGSITLNLATVAISPCVFVIASAPARFYADRGLIGILPIQFQRDLGPVGMAWRDRDVGSGLREFQAALRAACGGEAEPVS